MASGKKSEQVLSKQKVIYQQNQNCSAVHDIILKDEQTLGVCLCVCLPAQKNQVAANTIKLVCTWQVMDYKKCIHARARIP